jgi:hypothetical protein
MVDKRVHYMGEFGGTACGVTEGKVITVSDKSKVRCYDCMIKVMDEEQAVDK